MGNYRFAFDLGSGSIGWAVFQLNEECSSPVALIDIGVRVFPTGRDPQSKESNALGRRLPRQQRKQIDRRKKRRIELEKKLVEAGLIPPRADAEARRLFFKIDPYAARDHCARGRADLSDLGRAIWHMSKHRGFKSNRKTDRSNEDDTGKIAVASAELRKSLADQGAATYGSWLAGRHEKGEAVRVRPVGEGAKTAYDFYPARAMLEDEFDHIWRIQAPHHPALTNEAREAIRDTVFFQRPLKPVKPGRCTLFPENHRLPKWHPLAQEFLILQRLNTLKILGDAGERALDLTARDLFARHLMSGKNLTWAGLKTQLTLPRDTKFNLEDSLPKGIPGNTTTAILTQGTKKRPAPLPEDWWRLDQRRQLLLLGILAVTVSPERTIQRLQNWIGLPRDTAEKVAAINLPNGHLRLGRRAIRAIVEVMRGEVVVYSDAVRLASERGLFGDGVVVHHSDLRSEGDPGLQDLPRYNELPALQHMIGTGTNNPDDPPDIRYGKISNPTVHIALGQFRRVMNALIGRYGKPAQVVIEATRDMAKSARELNELDSTIKKNTRRNDKWREEMEAEGIVEPGARIGDRFLRMRLWEELGTSNADRLCPYSGQPISLHQLHSDAVEIDHILPFEDTFDDSPANKTVCLRRANRVKGKRAPGDAWSGEELEAMIARVKGAPGMKRKLWRFLPGALEKWQEDKGFEDRQLHATGYLAKVVRAYAEALFPKDGTSNIWMPPGRMTAMMRRRWGLFLPDHNAKTRDDHRHHALDAAVIGGIDRRTIQRLQTYARRIGAQELDRVLPDPPAPFEGFSEQVRDRVATLNVSHRPNRPVTKREAAERRACADMIVPSVVNGRLHEEYAYGLVRDIPENQAARTIGNLVKRKPVIELSKDEIGQVRDERLRNDLLDATEGRRADDREREAALKEWSERTGHRRVRLLVMDNTAMPVFGRHNHPREGEAYKWMIPGENAFVDILEKPDGTWFHHGTRVWEAASGIDVPWADRFPDARFIMRLYKFDTVQLFQWNAKEKSVVPGTNTIKVVRSIPDSPTNKNVRLVGTNLAIRFSEREKERDGDQCWEAVAYDVLRKRRARRVRIDELGRVRIVPFGKV